MALLQRPWFRRIWVQTWGRRSTLYTELKDPIGYFEKAAAARHILIMYGSMEINGYVFHLGINHFQQAHRDLESSTHSITYLIRSVIFGPKHAMSSLGQASLDICHPVELMERFHTYKATMLVDKVYALLGMSSDDPSTVGLLPDYDIPRENLASRILLSSSFINRYM